MLVSAAKPHYHHMADLMSGAAHHVYNATSYAAQDGVEKVSTLLYGAYLEPFKINFIVIAGLCVTGKALATRAYHLKKNESSLPITTNGSTESLCERGCFLAKKIALYSGAAICFGLAAYEMYATVSEYHSGGRAGNCKLLENNICAASRVIKECEEFNAKSELWHQAILFRLPPKSIEPARIVMDCERAENLKKMRELFYAKANCPSILGRNASCEISSAAPSFI